MLTKQLKSNKGKLFEIKDATEEKFILKKRQKFAKIVWNQNTMNQINFRKGVMSATRRVCIVIQNHNKSGKKIEMIVFN